MRQRHEHHEPVVAQVDAMDARIGGLLRRDADVGRVVEHPADHLG